MSVQLGIFLLNQKLILKLEVVPMVHPSEILTTTGNSILLYPTDILFQYYETPPPMAMFRSSQELNLKPGRVHLEYRLVIWTVMERSMLQGQILTRILFQY